MLMSSSFSILQKEQDRNDAPYPVSVRDLWVLYGKSPVLQGISVSLPSGSLAAIIGPNGAGKSTFLKAILDLVPRLQGTVDFFGGESFSQARRRIAFVPQRASVDWDFPATALDVVLMGLYHEIGPFRFAGRSHKARARAALDRVKMASLAERQIGQLSGGQQQRVFLARALVADADLMVLDEPFAGVDASTEQTLVSVFKELKASGRTILAVHHDLSTVRDIFDWVMLLSDGHLIAAGAAESIFTEQNIARTYGGRLLSPSPAVSAGNAA